MRSSYLGCVVKTAKFTCLALPAVQEFVQNKKHCKKTRKSARTVDKNGEKINGAWEIIWERKTEKARKKSKRNGAQTRTG